MSQKYTFEPDYAVAPCETLGDVIDSMSMSKKELAARTGLTEQTINRIFKGKQPISYETANKLELATGVSARMWNNLEARYREQLSSIKEREQLKKDIAWLEEIPVNELKKRGFIPKTSDKITLLRETLKFYGVSNVKAWRKIWDCPKVAARRSSCFETKKGPTSAWIRIGELEAQAINSAPFNKQKFKTALKKIRKLTLKNPEAFTSAMKKECANAGVALTLVPGIKGAPWSGATKWLSPKKAMVILNLRGKAEDRFWFSFFHEASHVLNDKKTRLYIANSSTDDPAELRANEFAAETLIPRKHDNTIERFRSRNDITTFAKQSKISKGIVAGRYQHLTDNWSKFKSLIRKLQWVEDE